MDAAERAELIISKIPGSAIGVIADNREVVAEQIRQAEQAAREERETQYIEDTRLLVTAARQDERRKVATVVDAAKVWEEMRTRTLKLIEAGEAVDFRSPEFDMGESEDALKRAVRALAEEVT